MPKIRFTKEDILSGNKLDPGWYKLAAKEVVEEIAKDKVSTNWIVKFVILEGPQAGVPIRTWFNEKRMKGVAEFLQCFTKVGEETEYELEDVIDRPVMGYCFYDQNLRFNTIQDFKPAGGSSASA